MLAIKKLSVRSGFIIKFPYNARCYHEDNNMTSELVQNRSFFKLITIEAIFFFIKDIIFVTKAEVIL